MSHHGSDQHPNTDIFKRIFEADREQREDLLHEEMRKSAGEYPDGRLNQDDEGQIPMEVGHHSGKVVVRFPKPITWIGLTGDGAMEMAQCLIEHARAVGLTKPATITL
jgi:hypothetical protein